LISFVLFSIFSFYSSPLFADYLLPLLVQDQENASTLPKHFRTTDDVLPPEINQTGLSSLHAAGSSAFSALAFPLILQKLSANSNHLIIIDLRQESHGFLNGDAVSWYGPQNAANSNQSDERIAVIEKRHLTRLNRKRRIMLHDILEKTPQGKI